MANGRRYREVYEHFATLIDTGKMQPGEQLPTHKEIGQLWNMSHATVTKAIRFLRDDSYVETSTVGTFVSQNRSALLYKQLCAVMNRLEALDQDPQMVPGDGVPQIIGRDGGVCWNPEAEQWETQPA